MIRSSITTAFAIAALAGPALAADMPAPTFPTEPVPAPAPAPLLFSWSGVYAGLNVGHAWGDYGFETTPGTTFGPLPGIGFDGDGFLAGAQLGANWQVDQFVFGIEGDIAWAGMDGEAAFGAPFAPYAVTADNRWLGTLRGRLGIALDQVLVYGTAGAAFTNIRASDTLGFTDSNTHTGWTVGAGVEAALTDAVSAKVEYLYADFGSRSYDLGDGAVRGDYDTHIVRAGLNYRFSW